MTPTRPPKSTKPTARTPPRPPHLVIENVSPELDAGRHPVKRLVGETLLIAADIFKDGHDLLRARARIRAPGDTELRPVPLTYDYGSDRWSGAVALDRIGRWTFTIEGWTDVFGTWRAGFEKKLAARQDVNVELLEGAQLVEDAARRVRARETQRTMLAMAKTMGTPDVPLVERAAAALDETLLAWMETYHAPVDLTSLGRDLAVVVDRERAGFAAWYELFPRSLGAEPGEHGTFADLERHLPRLAELGFDVIYLPPIHPIGTTFRKGKNNSMTPEPDDLGSPWAIGSADGGHTSVDPKLGTIEDFERLTRRADDLGMEIALDYALQCSPDHPWVREHPNWFRIRADGTIQYAENPPKKYQDIVPINFWTDDRAGLWNACRDILLFWIERGVKTFRVDNPHTKPFAFWEWCIAEVQREHPDVVFLSEAFTRPKKLLNLAKLGFTQSYTYFTWKNTTGELREFMTEFNRPEVLQYYRGNLFANTPDILHEYLQLGGRPAFRVRLLLAATLSPLYGLYSGYELAENVPLREGSEEYLNSEKYELRWRDFDAPGNLNADIRLLNRLRREYAALRRADNLTFHDSENERILFYRKAAPERGTHDLLIVVNVDPVTVQHGFLHVPLQALGLAEHEPYDVTDVFTGARYTWRGPRNYVRLDPARQPGHVLRIEHRGLGIGRP